MYVYHQSFLKKLVIDKENITHEELIANYFNTCFAQIGTDLEKTIETAIKFERFLKRCDSIQLESPLSARPLIVESSVTVQRVHL